MASEADDHSRLLNCQRASNKNRQATREAGFQRLFLCLGTAQPAWIWYPVLVLRQHAQVVFKPYRLAYDELFAAVVSVLENHAFVN